MGRRDQVHLPVVLKAWGDVVTAKCGIETHRVDPRDVLPVVISGLNKMNKNIDHICVGYKCIHMWVPKTFAQNGTNQQHQTL